MDKNEIKGGLKLQGEIYPQGAKNEALQVICASLLTPEAVTIRNIPDIKDVTSLIELIGLLGVTIERLDAHTYLFKADTVNIDLLNSPEVTRKAGSLRGSILIIGPLLARFGMGYISRPGGDKIGRRRLDTHFIGFEKLGAHF